MATFEDRRPDPSETRGNARAGADERQNSAWSLRRRSAIIPLTAAALIFIGFIAVIILAQSTPDVDGLNRSRLAEATTVYTADGQVLTRYYEENRNWVPLDSISDNVITALIDTEDERFYRHWGVDVQRTISAIFKTAAGNTQGGSTITMQLVRNVYPDIADDPDLLRKAKEWLTSLKIEHRYEKDEILEMYLNTVPFLYNAYGIDAAARTYFGKPAHELGILESATLVGMLKGPTLYNPVRNPEFSRERRNIVLKQMVEAGHLSQQQFAALRQQETPLDFSPITHEDNLAPYFAEYVRQWLRDWAKDKGYDIYKDGLQVYSTIDAGMQQAAEEAVKEQGRALQAVVDYEWSRPGGYSLGSDPSRYLEASGYEPFAYFWRSNPQVLDRLIRNDAAYRELVDQGENQEQALEKLRGDEAYVDSTNQESGAAFSALTYHILDHYFGASDVDWLAAYARLDARSDSTIAAREREISASRNLSSRPSLPLEQYAGTYVDPWYGNVIVTRQDDGLEIRFENTPWLVGDLEHWNYDTFVARWTDRAVRADAFVTFLLNPDGSIDQVKMQPVSPAVDFSFDFQDLVLEPISEE